PSKGTRTARAVFAHQESAVSVPVKYVGKENFRHGKDKRQRRHLHAPTLCARSLRKVTRVRNTPSRRFPVLTTSKDSCNFAERTLLDPPLLLVRVTIGWPHEKRSNR